MNGHPSRRLIVHATNKQQCIFTSLRAGIAKETLIVAKSIMLKIKINVSLSSQLIFVFLFRSANSYYTFSHSFFFFLSFFSFAVLSIFLIRLLRQSHTLVRATLSISALYPIYHYFYIHIFVFSIMQWNMSQPKLESHFNGKFSRLAHAFFFSPHRSRFVPSSLCSRSAGISKKWKGRHEFSREC